MPHSGTANSMEQESRSISYQSVTHKRIYSLMHRVDADSLMAAHDKQKTHKAVGFDGVGKDMYGQNLLGNVMDLVERMKTFDYVPQPVRRTYIPKSRNLSLNKAAFL